MTVAELLANNTSAADAFAGWPNGVPKASATSKEPTLVPQVKLVHRTDWWGGSSHPNIGVNSIDPLYAAKTVADMKARGFDGCTLDWYGPGSNEDKSLKILLPELVKQGMKFAICIDGGTKALSVPTDSIATRTVALSNIFSYISANYYNSPAYLNYLGRPVVLFFGVSGVDWDKVRAAAPRGLFFFRWEVTGYTKHPVADGYYGWTSCNEDWITGVKALGKQIILGTNSSFNNTVAGEPVKCTWGVTHPKVIDPRGGIRWAEQLELARKHPEIPFIHVATWNDYQEGSPIEPGIKSGLDLIVTLVGNELTWTPLTPAFSHADVYIEKDGKLTLEAAGLVGGISKLELTTTGLPAGTYTFRVHAIGINSVQNVLSDPINLTLGWSVKLT